MALNPNIILGGQGVDVVGQMGRGNALAQQTIGMNQDRERNALYREHGAGIAAGDQASINALAAMDPAAAQVAMQANLGMENTQLDMQATQQRMDILTREEQHVIQQQASQMSADERAAEVAKIEQGVASAMQAQTPEQWDAIVGQVDPSLVGQFDNRGVIAGRYMSVADSLKRFDEMNAPPEAYQPQSPLGKFYADQDAGVVPAGIEPPSSGVNVTTNVNGEDPDIFRNELDKSSAAMFTTLYENLPVAQTKMVQVENLAGLLENSTTGAGAAFKSWLGGRGVETEGLSEIQAVEAAISQMVPAQRTPGSGPMSDADLALFKLSLPRLINTPDGNKQILATMRGLAEYEASQSRIAAQVVSEQMTRQQGQDALMALPNPMTQYKDGGGGGSSVESSGQEVTAQSVTAMSDAQLQDYLGATSIEDIPDDVLDALEARMSK